MSYKNTDNEYVTAWSNSRWLRTSTSSMTNSKYTGTPLELPNNYIYISHLDEDYRYWRLPSYPDTISDTMNSTFQETTALGRSAPVYTYSQSGPRSVQIGLTLHRDLMDNCNMSWSNAKLGFGEDYVENLIHALQSIALPRYNLTNKAVEPPLVAVRLGNELFIKGIVNGAIGVDYEKPILSNDKYASLKITFTVYEVDPYDATEVFNNGSFRGVVSTMKGPMGFDSKYFEGE